MVEAYHPSSDARLTAALDAMMTTTDPLARLGATRAASRLVRASQDRQLLELLDAGTTQRLVAEELDISQQAVSRAEARAVARLSASRAHRKYVRRRQRGGS